MDGHEEVTRGGVLSSIRLSSMSAFLVAVASGALLWVATTALSGRREAWDSPLYWTVAYPAAVVIAGVLGALAPDRAWRWGLAIMLVQALTLAAATSSFGLLPLGLIMFAVLAVPPVGAAVGGAALRRRRERPLER